MIDKTVTDEEPITVAGMVERISRNYPSHAAVIHGTDVLSYAELETISNVIAARLVSEHSREKVIGISTSRSINMVTGVLGILKAGKRYLPLDPTYPETRLRTVSEDAHLQTILLTKEGDGDALSALELRLLETSKIAVSHQVEPIQRHEDVAGYVLYTSGSTGRPKGVQMGESALVNLLRWQQAHSRAGVGTRTLQFAPLTFDVSFQELFATLSTGGTVMLVDDDLRLNPLKLLDFIENNGVNRLFLPFVALQLLADTACQAEKYPSCIQEIMTAGEQLKITPQLRQFFRALPDACLYNQYGPTEAHVVTELPLTGPIENWPELPTIGFPIDNTEILILDDQYTPVPNGEVGELYISGRCLADGYLNNPQLTKERFFEIELPEKGTVRVYRSGDLAKFRENGEIEFLGRIDHQVKIRGHRVELGEIEAVLAQLPLVKDAVVVAAGSDADNRRLLAYVLADQPDKIDTMDIQRTLRSALPDYMIPAAIIPLSEFPKTSSGKVDRRALPIPLIRRPDLQVPYAEPRTALEKQIAGTWRELLNIDRLGINDNFFELGGNSILAQKSVLLLQQRYQLDLPITKLYQYGTVTGIAAFLAGAGTDPEMLVRPRTTGAPDEPIAVIGMAGRFPGAEDVDALWELLIAGQETIRFFAPEELDPSIPIEERNHPNYVRARGVLNQVEWFDERVFGLSPAIATIMDPQHRLFMELCRDVLEATGHLPGVYDGDIGVYAGCGANGYYLNNVLTNPDQVRKIGSFQAQTLNEKDYIASRTAYQLNLKGPAVSVFSACSTSLLAIAQAVDALRNGRCDAAVAGGATIKVPVNSGHIYEEGAMFSDDGHCRPFDAKAKGTVFSDGGGVVLLKRLSDAERDGDLIYAVIKGVGVNNDGSVKGSFTAPSAEGQAKAIAMAIADAGVNSDSIGYVETHGTATPLGDPIEIEGLRMAFGPLEKKQFCRIGSIKSNLGHLTHAAGVAGLIKTVLTLHHRVIPPSLHYEKPNPAIDFENSPFLVNDRLTEWVSDTPRRAGVSSFGVGGTNVHVVLEEYAARSMSETKQTPPPYLFTWSAATENSANDYATRLLTFLDRHRDESLSDIAATLNSTRPSLRWRNHLVAHDTDELVQQLSDGRWKKRLVKTVATDVVFMFPGQGAQYPGMGKALYDRFAIYQETVDTCAALLKETEGWDIRQIIFSDDAETLKNTRYTQPALFVTEYALAKLWMSWGILPSAFIGHSVGEFVAACLAEVFSLSDALKLVATRGRLISELPGGSMAAIRKPVAEVAAVLPEGLCIAANNAPDLCVVSGPTAIVEAFVREQEDQGVKTTLLHTSHAFHSTMMDPMLDDFAKIVNQTKRGLAKKPIASTVTANWLKDQEATSVTYWVNHVRNTVNFSEALQFAIAEMPAVLLEVGPGQVTATLARQHKTIDNEMIIGGLERNSVRDEVSGVLDSLGKLWALGLKPDWKSVHGSRWIRKNNLPTYAYDRHYLWLNPPVSSAADQPLIHQKSSNHSTNTTMRKTALISRIKQILDDAAGIEIPESALHETFIELGLDSLLLTQVAQTLSKEFGLSISFRKLNEELYNLDLLSGYLDQHLPPEPAVTTDAIGNPQGTTSAPHSGGQIAQPVPGAFASTVPPAMPMSQFPTHNTPVNYDSIALISQQISLIAQQIALLQANGVAAGSVPMTAPVYQQPAPNISQPIVPPTNGQEKSLTDNEPSPDEVAELKKPFGATARIERRSQSDLTDKQRTYLQDLIVRYNEKTKRSKDYTEQHRAYMADPRVVSGFRPTTKEITYSLVVNRSSGCHLWDIDGNKYIDALNGFGSSLLGNQPEVVKKALIEQIEEGYEIGPQHEKAGEVCRLICEFTGMDRAALCNTGSEAVLGAMRIARTVTGRSKIVAFTGSYHGIVDEVIVRGSKKLKSFPAASGIMPEAVQNMLILDYGTEESLRIIREHAHELAAVLVEPVQSRRPEFLPAEFLRELRRITEESGTALIFDEVISGFRFHPRGMQGILGIQADIGTYGKVAGGGISIGIIAGKRRFMDALDGGHWSFGDDSIPEIGVTYFAGTFVRHPLALATTKASLEYLKAQGPQLQETLNQNTERLVQRMNAAARRYGTPIYVAHFGSLWKIKYHEEYPYSELLFTVMRYKGIHIQDGFPCFLTTAHTDKDIEAIANAFEESIVELVAAEFIPSSLPDAKESSVGVIPPVPKARLGKDENGSPAWFIEDESKPGKYLKVVVE